MNWKDKIRKEIMVGDIVKIKKPVGYSDYKRNKGKEATITSIEESPAFYSREKLTNDQVENMPFGVNITWVNEETSCVNPANLVFVRREL